MILYETTSGIALVAPPTSIIAFYQYQDPQESLSSTKLLRNGELTDEIINFIKKNIKEEELQVNDTRLQTFLKDKLSNKISFIKNIREIKENVEIPISAKDSQRTTLFIAHKLALEDIKLSTDKIDKVIIQGINLLEDLDRDINIHVMKIKEWYSFHFPELQNVVEDNKAYLMSVKTIKRKDDWNEEVKNNLKDILNEKKILQIENLINKSMGTDMDKIDIEKICNQVESILNSWNYRKEMEEYIKERMRILAPNLSILLGEIIGAKLIAKAGSLFNLANTPASTLQILGAEKALFNALRTNSNTPKFGIIYHSPLLSNTPTDIKGKVARMLAAKASIAVRVDFYGGKSDIGSKFLEYLNNRIKSLENSFKGEKGKEKMQKKKIK
ncbi:Nucleolar protein nop5 [Spraguea lophii 42_110]|uniref:Nucleolar protein nop5 n=1 Tax=Spraguea lophii (strain 42_110) TaxID=1358809 RepID=S7XLY6_SPRLO|nr:Nucleolar protein nop5 [Spraguea lophii 42_110]